MPRKFVQAERWRYKAVEQRTWQGLYHSWHHKQQAKPALYVTLAASRKQ